MPISEDLPIRPRLRLLATMLVASMVLAPAAPPQTPGGRAPARTLDFAEVKPEVAGFSSQRLQRLHALLQKEVDDKQISGSVTVLARHGKIIDFQTNGKKDLASGAA